MMARGGPPVDREAAFVALFDAYYPKVLAYARRRLAPDAAEEAVADTFVTAWANFERVPPDPLIWLYGIARGAVANHRRRLLRSTRLGERARALVIEPVPPDVSDAVVWEDTFAAALAHLSESDREVLRLAHWEELSNAEGAVVLGCSTVAFKVRLHRARQRLRRYLQVDVGPTRRAAVGASASASAAAVATPRRRALSGPSVLSELSEDREGTLS
jgi:RNA polymerase sigma factor (sigma-70 family)